MTNRIAIFLGAALILLICVDAFFFGSGHLLFLGKKLVDLIEYLAFWR